MGRNRLRRKCSKLRTKESQIGGRGGERQGVGDSDGGERIRCTGATVAKDRGGEKGRRMGAEEHRNESPGRGFIK